jgi:hypothetical protein
MGAQSWDHATFTKRRDRLLETKIAWRFFPEDLVQAARQSFGPTDRSGSLIQA